MGSIIVNKVDYSHNYDVLSSGRGMVIPKYYFPDERSASQWSFGLRTLQVFYIQSDLCVKARKGEQSTRRGNSMSNARLILPVPTARKYMYENISVHMRDDNVKDAVEGDKRIIEYVNKLYLMVMKHISSAIYHIWFYWMFYDHFSARSLLAKLGRAIYHRSYVKLEGYLSRWTSYLQIWNQLMIAWIKKTGIFLRRQCKMWLVMTNRPNSTESHLLPWNWGHSLKRCAGYLRCEGLRSGNEVSAKEADIHQNVWVGLGRFRFGQLCCCVRPDNLVIYVSANMYMCMCDIWTGSINRSDGGCFPSRVGVVYVVPLWLPWWSRGDRRESVGALSRRRGGTKVVSSAVLMEIDV